MIIKTNKFFLVKLFFKGLIYIVLRYIYILVICYSTRALMIAKAQDWVQDSINSLIYVLILEIICDKPSYGYLIQNSIESKIKKIFPDYNLSFSSLYTILRKLETKYDLITTIECPDSKDFREKARRCYEITKNGLVVYQNSIEDWKKFAILLRECNLN